MKPEGGHCRPILSHERSFSASVTDVKICPNTRLFAVVLDRVSIAIFKSNCQRLATISICTKQKETISSYNWSPDGASIVVASSSGCLSIYSTDRCASNTSRTKRSSKDSDIVASVTSSAVVSALEWSCIPSRSAENRQRSQYASGYHDRVSSFYDNSLRLDHVGSGGLLLVGDKEGGVTLYTHNLQLKVARVQLLPRDVAVQRILVNSSHSHAVVLGYKLLEADQSDMGTNECIIRVLDLQSVTDFWPEINRINMEIVSVKFIEQCFTDTISRLRKEWKEGAMNVLTKTIQKQIEKRMKDFAEDISVRNAWGSLHDVFCGAFMRNALLQFLGTDLSESGAKEALRVFRSHADDVEEAIVSTLPLAEQMMFRASEYRGLARMEWRFAQVGVLLGEANKMHEASEAFYMALQELMHESQKMSREAEAFLAWLVIAAARAGGASVERRDLPTMDKMSTKDRQLASDFLERMTGDIESKPRSGDYVTDLLNTRLTNAYQKLKDVIQSVFEMPARVISSQLAVCGQLSVNASAPNTDAKPFFSTREAMKFSSQKQVVLLCLSQLDGALLFVQYNFRTHRWNACRVNVVLNQNRISVKEVGYVGEGRMVILGEAMEQTRELKQTSTCLAFQHHVMLEELFNESDEDFNDGELNVSSASVATKLRTQESSPLHLGQLRADERIALSTVHESRFASVLIKSNRVLIIEFEIKTSS